MCVIDSGRAGLIHARNVAGGIPGARLVALVDPVSKALEKAVEELGAIEGFLDYREALKAPEVNAVVIPTPTACHRDIADRGRVQVWEGGFMCQV